jgi:hypothetical protein
MRGEIWKKYVIFQMQHFHPWRVQAKIFDFVKVAEGAQQPKQSIIHWIASLRSQ